jgi:hypothetical protein
VFASDAVEVQGLKVDMETEVEVLSTNSQILRKC